VALVEGDEFRIPISLSDKTSPAFMSISRGVDLMTGKFGQAQVIINQSLELIGKASRALGSTFDVTVGRAINLEKNIAEVATLISGDASQATALITREILNLQSQFGSSQQDLARAYYQAISSGAVGATNAQGLLTAAQKLAVGGVTTLAVATDGLTNIMNAYGLDADQAASVSDALFIGMRAGKTTVEELSTSLGRAASLAATTGVSFEELIGSVSAITTGGVKTAEAITQVRAAVVELSKQTPPLQKILSRLNITSIQNQISQNGLVNTLKLIVNETDGSTEALTKLFGSIESVNAILALTGDSIGPKFQAIMADMSRAAANAGATTEEAFAKIAQTTDFQLNLAQARLVSQLTRLGQLLKPIFLTIVNVFNSFVAGLTRGLDILGRAQTLNLDPLIRALKVLAATITTALVAMNISAILTFANALSKTLLKAVLGVIPAIASFTVGMTLATASLVAANAPFLLIGGAITGLTATVGFLIERFLGLQNLLNSIAEVANTAFTKITSFATPLLSVLTQISTLAGSVLGPAFEGVGEVGSQALGLITAEGTLVGDALGVLVELFDTSASSAVNLGDQVATSFGLAEKSGVKLSTVIKAVSEESLELVQTLTEENRNLEIAIGSIGSGRRAQIQTQLDSELRLIDLQQQKLEEEGKLTDEIRTQLGLRRGLLEEQASATESQVGQVQVFGPDQKENILSVFGEGASVFASGFSDSLAGSLSKLEVFTKVVDSVQGLINIVPATLSKIAGIFTSLTALPQMILDGLLNVISSIGTFITDFIPNLLAAIPRIATALFITLPKVLSDAIFNLINSFPEIIDAFIDSLPQFISGLVNAIPQIAIALAEFLIKDAPRIAVALARALAIDLPIALVQGIISAFNLAGRNLSNLFSGIFPVDQIEKGVKSISDKVARSTDQLFSVADLEASQRGLDVADRIRNAILSSTSTGANIFSKAWERLKDWFTNKFGPLVAGAWQEVLRVANDFGLQISRAWQDFSAGVLFAAGEFGGFVSRAWEGFSQAVTQAATSFGSFISLAWQAFLAGVNSAANIFSNAINSLITVITRAFGNLFDFADIGRQFQEMFNRLNPLSGITGGGGGGSDIGSQIGRVFGFSEGGRIPGFATGGYVDVPTGTVRNGVLNAETGAFSGGQGTDTIRANLTPGEFVVNREATRNNLGLLSFINEAKRPVTSSNESVTNMTVIINAKTDLSADQIRREVIPTLEKELRKKSQQGRYILDSAGIRT